MQRNSFIQMNKLSNVAGRINYITSHAKQENLYAVYETTERSFWKELAKCNQDEFKKSGTEGKCIEARELIIALPESFPDLYDSNELLQLFTNRFKEKHGVECISALHHNKIKTNYHIHLIFSERERLLQPIEKVATRNMFFDEQGKHVRTKKEILDERGNVRKGCKIIKKNEAYERSLFTIKNKQFKQDSFVNDIKHFYTDLINLLVEDEKDKLQVFDKNSLYLPTKKIGKNNLKAEQIEADNEKRMQWNREVDRALVSAVPEGDIQQIKKEYITDQIKTSIAVFGNQPEYFGNIVTTAVMALAILISKVLQKARDVAAGILNVEPKQKKAAGVTQREESVPDKQRVVEPQIPPQPTMPPDAAAYPKLEKIYAELQKQNEAISVIEKERSLLEIEHDDLRGFKALTKKGELQTKIDRLNSQAAQLKGALSKIVKRYYYYSVQEFYGIYYASKAAAAKYQDEVKKWEVTYGIEAQNQSVKVKLEEYRKKVREQEKNHIYYYKGREI